MAVERYMEGHAMDINDSDPLKDNALHFLFRSEHFSVDDIRWFLRMGASINSVDGDKATPLHIATLFDNCTPEVIKLLLDNGANVHARDEDNFTPLLNVLYMCHEHAFDIVVQLLDHGADINAMDRDCRTPLYYAVTHKSNVDMVKLLLDRGANFQLLRINAHSPLHSALTCAVSCRVVKFLIDELGANVEADSDIKSPLHVAAALTELKSIKLLLNYGAQMNALDSNNCTPLHYAVENRFRASKRIEVSKMLLDSGALLSCGESPLKVVIDKYNFDRYYATLKNVKFILKYALLENVALNIEDDIYSSSYVPAELNDFREECLWEIREMEGFPVGNTNFLQFLFRSRLEWKHEREDGINCICDTLLEVIYTDAFPLYNEVIFGVVKREHMEDKLKNLTVYAVSDPSIPGIQKSVILYYDVLRVIARYLSKADLLNFISI